MKLILSQDDGTVLQTWTVDGSLRKEFPQRVLCRELLEEISHWLPPDTQSEQEEVEWEPLKHTPQPAPVQKPKKQSAADMKTTASFLAGLTPEELEKFAKGI